MLVLVLEVQNVHNAHVRLFYENSDTRERPSAERAPTGARKRMARWERTGRMSRVHTRPTRALGVVEGVHKSLQGRRTLCESQGSRLGLGAAQGDFGPCG